MVSTLSQWPQAFKKSVCKLDQAGETDCESQDTVSKET